ncbi:MAG: hypothetical protein HYV03_06740 [Deltaproteobacteria bacterium]|nr:hypothetical protein [Deltaproteobacteria bacterium]
MNEDNTVVHLDPLALVTRDRELAEKALNRLSLAGQLRVILSAPLAQREQLISLSRHASVLTQALPVEEFWLTLAGMDTGEAPALLQFASAEQLEFCIDADGWRKDRWQPAPTLRWLQLIAACGETKVAAWWRTIDPELAVLLMKQWITIYLRAGDEDVATVLPWPRPEEPPATFDNAYYFQCQTPQIDEVLRPMLDVLAHHDMPRLRQLFDATIGAIGAEQEEAAYAARERRMADMGFPQLAEAIGCYARVRPEQWPALQRPVDAMTIAGEAAPRFALIPLSASDWLLGQAMRALDDPEDVDRLALEIARLANRVVIADGGSITPASVLHAATKALGYVNIGLELVGGNSLDGAVRALRSWWAQSLFQIGFSAVADLRDRALALWERLAQTGAETPDDPEAALPYERVRAAAWKWPKYYIGPVTPDGVIHRDFRSLADLAAVQTALVALGYGA